MGFQMVQVVKNLPASVGDIRDPGSIPRSERSPGGGHGIHSSILIPGGGHDNPFQYSAWSILRTEEPGGLWFVGSQRVAHDRATNTQAYMLSVPGGF